MPEPSASALPADVVQPTGFLHTLLAMSLTAVAVLRPLYAEDGETIHDFAWVSLNPAGQRMIGQPERPTASLLTLFPTAQTDGVFEVCRRAFETGEPGRNQTNYQADGLDGYFLLVAQRYENVLVVNFTDTNDQPRTPVEAALRETQAAEQDARAEAERQRQRFHEVLMQLPAYVAVYHGPDHIYQLVNPPYQSMFPHRAFLGRPLQEIMPEANGLGVVALFDRVYQTGEPYHVLELEGWFDFQGTGEPEQVFFNLHLQPLRDAQGRVDGVLDYSHNVTEQVRARRQVEQLNAELEERVRERTAQVLEQQRLLQHLLESVPAAIATLSGPEHRFSFANARYQHLVGHRAQVGQAVAQALPEVVEQGVIELLDRVYQTGEPYIGQGVMIMLEQPPGPPHQLYYDLTYLPLRDGQGQVQGILVFAVEVTEQVRNRRQTALLQAELLTATQTQAQERAARQDELQRLFEQAPVAIAVFRGPQYVIELANSSVCALWGRTQAQALGRPLFELLPEAAGQGFEQLLDQVRTTGEPFVAHELPSQIDRNGQRETVYWNFVYAPLREADGTIERVTVVATDGTEQVRNRQQVDTAAAELRLLTAHSPAFLFRTDAAGSLAYLNKEFFEWTGLDASRLRSLDEGWATVHPGDLAVQQPSFVAAVQAGQPWLSTPYRFRRHDGQYRWMLSRSQPLLGAGGEVLGHSGLTFEVHEQVELQQQLERTNVDLDTFVYAASHDLKAPIANIEGLLNALREHLPAPAPDPIVPRLLDMMQGAVGRFQQTVGHLTDIARLQDTLHQPPVETLDLAQALEDVRLDLLPLLEGTRTDLSVAVEACPGVRFSAQHLRSVLFNLLSNAVKYRHPDRPPVVQVRAQCTATQLVLAVQDNGLGLSPQQQSQLFTMFRCLHTHVEGSGVGLYLIKRTIENAGGTLTVQSQPDVGSTFTVTLPRA